MGTVSAYIFFCESMAFEKVYDESYPFVCIQIVVVRFVIDAEL